MQIWHNTANAPPVPLGYNGKVYLWSNFKDFTFKGTKPLQNGLVLVQEQE